MKKSFQVILMTSFLVASAFLGGKHLFTSKEAYASGSETLLQTIRVFYRMGMGTTPAEYNALISGNPNIAVITGVDGLVGKLNSIRKNISNSILANNPNIAECQDVPASGQFASGNYTVKFATPKHTAPASYPTKGGVDYEKRVEVTEVIGTRSVTAVFEFHCNVASSMLAYKFVDTADTGLNHKMGIFYDGEDYDDKRFQFYFDWPTQDVHMAVVMEVTNTQYKSWVSSGKDNGDSGYRMAAIGHLNTGKVSFFADDTTGGDGDANDPNPRHEETTVVATNAPASGNSPYQSCADGFDTPNASMTTNALCGTDTLAEGSADLPGLSDLATKTVYDQVSSGIDQLLAL